MKKYSMIAAKKNEVDIYIAALDTKVPSNGSHHFTQKEWLSSKIGRKHSPVPQSSLRAAFKRTEKNSLTFTTVYTQKHRLVYIIYETDNVSTDNEFYEWIRGVIYPMGL